MGPRRWVKSLNAAYQFGDHVPLGLRMYSGSTQQNVISVRSSRIWLRNVLLSAMCLTCRIPFGRFVDLDPRQRVKLSPAFEEIRCPGIGRFSRRLLIFRFGP